MMWSIALKNTATPCDWPGMTINRRLTNLPSVDLCLYEFVGSLGHLAWHFSVLKLKNLSYNKLVELSSQFLKQMNNEICFTWLMKICLSGWCELASSCSHYSPEQREGSFLNTLKVKGQTTFQNALAWGFERNPDRMLSCGAKTKFKILKK